MEERAVRVSHELWKQLATQGYTGSFQCLIGLPEDAEFVTAFYQTLHQSKEDPSCWEYAANPVFVFASERWVQPAGEHTVCAPWGEEWPVFVPTFQAAECRTCKWWGPTAHRLTGECCLTREDDFVPVHKESAARGVASCDDPHPISWLQTEAGFGCTQYEPREIDD